MEELYEKVINCKELTLEDKKKILRLLDKENLEKELRKEEGGSK